MSKPLHSSPVRFADKQTLDMLQRSVNVPDEKIEHFTTMVGTMFDRTRLRINTLVQRSTVEIGQRGSVAWEMLRDDIADRIIMTIRVLSRFLDLRSNEWKNAPAIWEMLSFDERIIRDQNTPLPDALRMALEKIEHLLPEDIDHESFVNDLDEVIHQTHGRRVGIERMLNAAVSTDLGDTPLLETHEIPNALIAKMQMEIRENVFSDTALQAAAAEAICRACNGETPETFSVTMEEVARVTGEQALSSLPGDVYLVRSKNVATLGDHYIVITGGLVQKPHGLRPEDISFPVNDGEKTPLEQFDPEEPLVLLKLNDAARQRFYKAYDVPLQYHRP